MKEGLKVRRGLLIAIIFIFALFFILDGKEISETRNELTPYLINLELSNLENNGTNSTNETYCIDSDGGLNYFEYGWVQDYLDLVPFYDYCTLNGSQVGSCIDPNLNCGIIEKYCVNGRRNGHYIFGTEFDNICPNGCLNGACVGEQNETYCIDSDGGLNYFVKGTGILSEEHLDYCGSYSNDLYEHFCDSKIKKNQYFFISSYGEDIELQYKGADKITDTNPQVTIEDMRINSTSEVALNFDGSFNLKLDGKTWNFINVSSAVNDDFDIVLLNEPFLNKEKYRNCPNCLEGVCVDVEPNTTCGDGICAGISEEREIQNNEVINVNYKGLSYTVEVFVSAFNEAMFTINGENTNKLDERDTYRLSNGIIFYVKDITYQAFAGGEQSAEFFLGEDTRSCPVDCEVPLINQSCMLTNAYWSVDEASIGSLVSMYVEGENCNVGETVVFQIWEDDFIFDDYIDTVVGIYTGGFWEVSDEGDIQGNSEYYFIVNSGISSNSVTSGLLQVIELNITNPSCITSEDCPNVYGDRYCSEEGNSCQSVGMYDCSNLTGECFSNGGGVGCSSCSNGCLNGECVADLNISCYNNLDCGEDIHNSYCSNGSACVSTVTYFCNFPGTLNSICSSSGGGGCTLVCPNGCLNGECIIEQNETNVIGCTDSDGGLDYYVKGTTGAINNTLEDICGKDANIGGTPQTENSLQEFFCENGFRYVDFYECPSWCDDGACVEGGGPECVSDNNCVIGEVCVNNKCVNAVSNGSYCTDTDGGLNLFVKGTLSSSNMNGIDTCLSYNVLLEYWCNSSTGYNQNFSCPNGYVCGQGTGACISTNSSDDDYLGDGTLGLPSLSFWDRIKNLFN